MSIEMLLARSVAPTKEIKGGIMNPTKEQQVELWEGCGVEPEVLYTRITPVVLRDGTKTEGGRKTETIYPPIDLNNLFNIAVPKLDGGLDIRFSKFDDTGWFVRLENQVMTTEDEDPALALFWALYPVITGKKK